jgi:gliding motility-associated-like protein
MKNIFLLALLTLANVFTFAHGHKNSESDFHFTENKGQINKVVKYHTKLHVGDIYFESNAFTFDLYSEEDLNQLYQRRHTKKGRELADDSELMLRKNVYKMNFVNSNSSVLVSGNEEMEGVKNYLRGNDPSSWASNVKSYYHLNYTNLYNNIDAEVYPKSDFLKYDFIVKVGGNPNDIMINYEGVSELRLNNGSLEVTLPNTSVKELAPIAYQVINGTKVNVNCKFNVNGTNVSFMFPDGYNTNEELIIDPTWVFSSLSGSTADNWGFTATYDEDENFYGGGIAFSSGFPTTVGAYDVTFGSVIDVAIIKFNPTGTARIYATYLGGNRADQPHSLVTNAAGELVIMGATASTNFPTSPGAYSTSHSGGNTVSPNSAQFTGGSDIFVTKLNAAGNSLIGSTYIGGSGNDGLSLNTNLQFNYSDENRGEVVIDDNGDIYIASTSNSTNYPTTAGCHQPNRAGNYDAVVSKFSATLDVLHWSTYLGGTSGDAGYSIRVNETNNTVAVCGGTVSNDIGTTPGVIKPTYGGSTDGYIGVFNNNNGSLSALTYIGTGDYDQAYILEVDKFGNIFTTGQTKGAYPVSAGVYSNANSPQFIHKMSSDLTTTDFSTVFGSGSNTAVDISITAFLVDNCSNVYVAGWGGGSNNEGFTDGMPVTGDAIDGTTDGSDFYFIVLERDAQSLLYGTYFGDASSDEHVDGGTSRFDKKGTIYQGVCAACGGGNNFPTSPGAYSSTNGSSNCNFGAIKIGLDFQGVTASAIDPGPQTLCNPPFDVNFDAGTTPPPNTYWDFGDATTLGIGIDYTPTHTYADSGTYTVMYVAIDSSSCNIADTVYFTVDIIQTGTLTASIDIPPYDPCTVGGLTVDYNFTGTGADSLWWDMGNGTTYIDSVDFSYTYNTPGTYYVEMQAYEFACGGFVSIKDTIDFNPVFTSVTAVDPGPQTLCNPPFDVTFDAGGTPPNTYWDFGDGTTLGVGVDYNPTHTYSDSGTYIVMSVAIDSNSCNFSDTAYFTVDVIQTGTLDAQINIPSYDPCSVGGLTVNYNFTGSGADSLWWDMGDGTTYSDSVNFNYIYNTPGTYYVEMQAYEFACGGFVSIIDTIDFNPVFTSVTAVDPGDQTICNAPFNVDFDAGGTPANTFWDFGDGTTLGIGVDYTPTHTYADTGSYVVMSVAIDSSTCNIADTAYFNITLIQPEQLDAQIVIPAYDPCTTGGLTVDYSFTGTGADSLWWDMGDGTTYIDSVNFSYTYNTPGTYYVEMQAYEFACGTSAIIMDTIDFNPVFTSVTAVDPGDQTICTAPFNVDFDAGGTPPNTFWNFGDGTTLGIGVDYTPTHTYADTGSYVVMSVAIDSSTCNIADTAYFNISIIQPEELDAQFVIPPYDPCQSTLNVNLSFTGTGADSLYWNMGNGDVFVNDQNVNYTYTTPGEFVIELLAYDFDCNVTESIKDTIRFFPTNAQVNTNVDPNVDVCGSNLAVNFSSGNPAPPQNYWDFGDGNTSTSIDPVHTYLTSGTYNGFFVAIDSNTCNIADTMYFPITVNLIPELSVNFEYVPPVPCEAINYSVELAANAEGADSIYWTMGDGTEFINDTIISYEYAGPGTYPITVTLFKEGCAPKVFSNGATFIELAESSGIVPNVFTPNGDGFNDELVFLGVDNTENYSIRIFNRWGQTVFESTDAQDNWDGKGSNDGTYFYELRYTDVCSNEEKLVTGYVTLIGKN